MNKTAIQNQKSKAQLKREVEENVRAKVSNRINALMQTRAELLEQQEKLAMAYDIQTEPYKQEFIKKTKAIAEEYKADFDTVNTSLKAAEKEIVDLVYDKEKEKVLHPALFDVSGNWRFEKILHYLHIKREAEAVEKKGFDLSKFVKKFLPYVNVQYNLKDLKTLFTDGDMRKKSGIDKFHFDLKFNESIEFKTKKEKANEQAEQKS